MQWDVYTVFSVVSGIAMFAMAFAPWVSGKERVWAVVAGALLTVFGFFVAAQDSGTWSFPVGIFVIPFVVAAAFARQYFRWRRSQDGAAADRLRP